MKKQFDYDNHWHYRNELIEQLQKDAIYNYEEYLKSNSQISLRNYIRSLFSLYEGVLANLREKLANRIQTLYLIGALNEINIHDLYLLMDEAVSINERGGVNKKFNANSFEKLLKFVIKKACELNKIEDQIFNQGWNDFKSFIKIRDRITHPKYEEGILVSEDDYKIIENAKKWWDKTLIRVFI